MDARLPRHRLGLSVLATNLLAVSVIGCGVTSGGLPVGRIPPRTADVGAIHPNQVVVHRPIQLAATWRVAATVGGRVAAWTARRSGVTLMRFDQGVVHLALHAGGHDPGGSGWTYGDRIGVGERGRVVAAFNSGFKFAYGSVGFFADGRAAVPLQAGLASIVTYRDGMTQIGTWAAGVPARGMPIASVRQNLTLLVDHGIAANSVDTCIQACWGGTIGYLPSVARSALGIDAAGRLVWAAAEHVTPGEIARALVSAGAVRALELDINPKWVAGYLYSHDAAKLTAVPVLPGQKGIYGEFLRRYSRDFLTVLAN
jgi:hypothetical protein